jgi:hypothetical protein
MAYLTLHTSFLPDIDWFDIPMHMLAMLMSPLSVEA